MPILINICSASDASDADASGSSYVCIITDTAALIASGVPIRPNVSAARIELPPFLSCNIFIRAVTASADPISPNAPIASK